MKPALADATARWLLRSVTRTVAYSSSPADHRGHDHHGKCICPVLCAAVLTGLRSSLDIDATAGTVIHRYNCPTAHTQIISPTLMNPAVVNAAPGDFSSSILTRSHLDFHSDHLPSALLLKFL